MIRIFTKYWWKEKHENSPVRIINNYDYNIGDYYDDGKNKGLIVELKRDGTPAKIMSLKFERHGDGSWNDEDKYFKEKGNGWYMPSQEELMRAWSYHEEIDKTVDSLKEKGVDADHICTYNDNVYYWCWSSSGYSSDIARAVGTGSGRVYSTTKSGTNAGCRVRAFFAL